MQKVEVLWLDTAAHHGWHPADQVKVFDAIHVRSVGYLFSMDDEWVKMTQSVGETGDVAEVLVIPQCCIQDIWVLEEVEE
jgi:hypothetical protein